NTHWNLSATMLSCPWSIWDSFRGIQSHTSNRSFGWITIKIHNKIKYLKVLTYDDVLQHSQNGWPLSHERDALYGLPASVVRSSLPPEARRRTRMLQQLLTLPKAIPGWLNATLIGGAFATLLWLEYRRPLRRQTERKLTRNIRNLALAACSAVAI